ncbi:MAG: sigma-70 family RNA polymerase sigma factor [Chloroflexi bacterium]|nr:MAG: sigma-70 family RNA polymerase sigma factor [Chloroflexota bacterium]TMC34259.1 MAG: sigma-70 family RNA polymerase sigma factor [Chloroflexota bacterium]TMC58247.1 MAG: sigma-70 family RNA polymerase sigma factor [Chloroflexota bacterium]
MTDIWRELYDTEYPRLLRALLAIGGDPDAAEDAAQEAFVKAHRTGIERLERPGAWLLVVGTRELLRHRRRRRIEAQRWAERGDAEAPGTDSLVDRADLLAALRQLPERQRTVVVARYYYDLSYEEIARLFGIKSGTVGATLHQAIDKLRQIHVAGRLARGAMR